jgi:peptide methionine sulfoxide reductase MsrB
MQKRHLPPAQHTRQQQLSTATHRLSVYLSKILNSVLFTAAAQHTAAAGAPSYTEEPITSHKLTPKTLSLLHVPTKNASSHCPHTDCAA